MNKESAINRIRFHVFQYPFQQFIANLHPSLYSHIPSFSPCSFNAWVTSCVHVSFGLPIFLHPFGIYSYISFSSLLSVILFIYPNHLSCAFSLFVFYFHFLSYRCISNFVPPWSSCRSSKIHLQTEHIATNSYEIRSLLAVGNTNFHGIGKIHNGLMTED